MKTLYGTCPNEHLLWRYSMDRTLSIYYWAGDIMPDESKLPVAWGDAGNTVLDETRMAPIDDVKMTMLELEVKDISYWVDGSAGIKGEEKADYPQSFFHFLNRLMIGDPVSRYIMPDKAIINEFPNATPDSRVRNFLNHAVPIVWKKIIGTKTALEKCDIAIQNMRRIVDVYGPDPVFSKALKLLDQARQEIAQEPAAKDDEPKKIKWAKVEKKESSDSAFKVTVKKDDLYALADSYNYLQSAEIADKAKQYLKNDINLTRELNYLQSAEIARHDDPVNHPSHYQLHGGMEVIDIIEAVTWDLPSDEAYAIGNAIKYICRYRNKGKPVQDLEKAKWYLNRAIEDYKKSEKGE